MAIQPKEGSSKLCEMEHHSKPTWSESGERVRSPQCMTSQQPAPSETRPGSHPGAPHVKFRRAEAKRMGVGFAVPKNLKATKAKPDRFVVRRVVRDSGKNRRSEENPYKH
jgi:hypothetical protein